MTSQKERPNVLQLLRGDAVQEDSDSKKVRANDALYRSG